MKPYELMSDDEKDEFLLKVARIKKILTAGPGAEVDAQLRPAFMALWIICHDRAITNVKTHYEVDPSGFIDEAVRGACLMMENIAKAVHSRPQTIKVPPGLESVADRMAHETVNLLRMASYRRILAEVVEDFLRDSKERGEL